VSNYYELLDLPLSYEVSSSDLDAHYRALSLQWHPDKVVDGDPKARLAALERTAALNQAYKTLRDPLLRAGYLLKVLGKDLDDEGERTFQMDPKFLMEILELREELDAVAKKGDVPRALELGKQMAEREQATHHTIQTLFDEQVAAPDPQRLTKLADHVAALRYYRRFQDEVSAIDEATQA